MNLLTSVKMMVIHRNFGDIFRQAHASPETPCVIIVFARKQNIFWDKPSAEHAGHLESSSQRNGN